MINYQRMNRILEEQGTCEKAQAEALSYAEHEADLFISKMENQSEADAGWQLEVLK